MKVLLVLAVLVLAVIIVIGVFWYRRRGASDGSCPSEGSPPVQMVDPSKLLFSLATICDRLPPVTNTSAQPAADDLVLHEDDWRQIEFVAFEDSAYILQQLAALRQFKVDAKVGLGYKGVSVRKDHPHELPTLGLSFEQLRNSLVPTSKQGKLFLSSGELQQEVEGGFSFRLPDGNAIYGYSVHGVVAALGLEPAWRTDANDATAQAIATIGNSAKVLLVDWYWAQEISPTDATDVQKWMTDHAEQTKRIAEELAKKKH
jgi:hypothetical protein